MRVYSGLWAPRPDETIVFTVHDRDGIFFNCHLCLAG
jgi:hypothetical protein